MLIIEWPTIETTCRRGITVNLARSTVIELPTRAERGSGQVS